METNEKVEIVNLLQLTNLMNYSAVIEKDINLSTITQITSLTIHGDKYHHNTHGIVYPTSLLYLKVIDNIRSSYLSELIHLVEIDISMSINRSETIDLSNLSQLQKAKFANKSSKDSMYKITLPTSIEVLKVLLRKQNSGAKSKKVVRIEAITANRRISPKSKKGAKSQNYCEFGLLVRKKNFYVILLRNQIYQTQ